MDNLLIKESPIIATIVVTTGIISYYYNYKIILAIIIIIFIFLLYFYRHYPIESEGKIPDNIIISPCNGTVTNLLIDKNTIYISIFLSPLDVHSQVYPANGMIRDRIYDETGKFNLVVDAGKSKENEKVIQWLQLPNGVNLQITQIAGFLPRRISYDDTTPLPHKVIAGSYLGMIKFGSRVDLLLQRYSNKSEFKLFPKIIVGQKITAGDIIGRY